jgi:hypothetical protein
MKLDVPLVRQPKDSILCGIAVLTMLLKYHEGNASFEKLRKEIKIDKTGTYAPQMGIYLLKRGYSVSIVTLHPKLFTNQDIGMPEKQILSRLTEALAKFKDEKNKKVLKFFIKFIKAGGKVIVKVPALEDIKAEIDNKRPVCALMTSNFLFGKAPGFNFHYNVITGYDDKYFYANDPLWDERGGKKKYEINDFFYALYASAYEDLDNASLMLVKKK